MAFHDNLRTLRLARGLTQPALAEKADIEQSYLSKLENGRSRPSDEVLTRLAQALETAPETLLGNGDESGLHRHWLVRAAIAAAVVVALLAGFLIGRTTAIYPLSAKQLLAGKMPAEDITQQLMLMAPVGIDVIDISHMGNGTQVSIMGKTASAVLVNNYMDAIRKKYGGDFQDVMISPPSSGAASHFSILYKGYRIAAAH
ncbi:MAG TPA: helix-turn-helix transcriptional regulator [Gammaproteobacteria bacterium]|nr:helix-turn-helix transcriptional regulator [Gammaproteobacteria bacterium]